MKGLKEIIIVVAMVTGLMVTGKIGADEIVLEDDMEEFYYEEGKLPLDLLNEEENVVLELVPERIVTSDYYELLTFETLTEEEVLEALAGLSTGEHAVERALSVFIAGNLGENRFNGIIHNALSDREEVVRAEAEFFKPHLLVGEIKF